MQLQAAVKFAKQKIVFEEYDNSEGPERTSRASFFMSHLEYLRLVPVIDNGDWDWSQTGIGTRYYNVFLLIVELQIDLRVWGKSRNLDAVIIGPEIERCYLD